MNMDSLHTTYRERSKDSDIGDVNNRLYNADYPFNTIK